MQVAQITSEVWNITEILYFMCKEIEREVQNQLPQKEHVGRSIATFATENTSQVHVTILQMLRNGKAT